MPPSSKWAISSIHSVVSTVIAQKLHSEMVPDRSCPPASAHCMEEGRDLSQGGARYNVGPVLTGIGLAVVANSLAVIKKLVFEDKVTTLAELDAAMNADWEGYEALRTKALAVVKYGNDDDYVDASPAIWPTIIIARPEPTKDNFDHPSTPLSWHLELYPDRTHRWSDTMRAQGHQANHRRGFALRR